MYTVSAPALPAGNYSPGGLVKSFRAKGHFTGVGTIDIPVTNLYDFYAPDRSQPLKFGIAVNPGPEKSYVMTAKIGPQPNSFYNPTNITPGNTNVNMLPGTGSIANLPPWQVSFIGSV